MGGLVVAFFGQHGASLDVEAELQKCRERVGEISDTECSHQTGNVA